LFVIFATSIKKIQLIKIEMCLLTSCQKYLDLSINKTLKLASELRKAATAKIFESNIKTKLRDTYHSVDEFFQIAKIDYVEEVNREVKSVTTKATIRCFAIIYKNLYLT
jgi:hypothetical protein